LNPSDLLNVRLCTSSSIVDSMDINCSHKNLTYFIRSLISNLSKEPRYINVIDSDNESYFSVAIGFIYYYNKFKSSHSVINLITAANKYNDTLIEHTGYPTFKDVTDVPDYRKKFKVE